MPPTTKSDTAKHLLGQPDSVLRPDFILAVEGGDLEPNLLPFTGPLQLPSSEATLKLYFFYRNTLGKKYSKISRQDIVSLKYSNNLLFLIFSSNKRSLSKSIAISLGVNQLVHLTVKLTDVVTLVLQKKLNKKQ